MYRSIEKFVGEQLDHARGVELCILVCRRCPRLFTVKKSDDPEWAIISCGDEEPSLADLVKIL